MLLLGWGRGVRGWALDPPGGVTEGPGWPGAARMGPLEEEGCTHLGLWLGFWWPRLPSTARIDLIIKFFKYWESVKLTATNTSLPKF